MKRKHFLIFIGLLFISARVSSAEIKTPVLLTSDTAVQVTLFRDSEQKPDEAYLLIEGTGTEWDDRLTVVKVKEIGPGMSNYEILWKEHPYTILVSRFGSYSLSIPKPYKEYSGLSIQRRAVEVKIDTDKLESLLDKSTK